MVESELSALKCDWLNSLSTFCDATYISIQEHFRKSKTIDKIPRDNFLIRAPLWFRNLELSQTQGRPQGGIAQLSRTTVAIRKDRVISNSNHVQAKILNFQACKLLWINAYLPCDPHTVTLKDEDEEKLLTVLTEIERKLVTASYDDVLMRTDMNWDMSRSTAFALTVSRFIERLNLRSLWEHHDVDIAHVHTDLKSVSTIDHFICKERLLLFVASARPVHVGDNPSWHAPIMLMLKMGELPAKMQCEAAIFRQPAWYKVTTADCEAFKNDLNMKIEAVAVPNCLQCQNVKCKDESHSVDRDGFMLDLLSSVIDSSHATIPIVGGQPRAARPDSGCVPGWRDAVAVETLPGTPRKCCRHQWPNWSLSKV